MKPGDGVIGLANVRGVVIDTSLDPWVKSGRGISVDFQLSKGHAHFFYPEDRLYELKPDPQGPFAPIRKFTCTLKGCCHSSKWHKNKGTALTTCPNCGSPIIFND